MLRIPINRPITVPNGSAPQSGNNSISHRTLFEIKDDWIIECVWGYGSGFYRPDLIEIYHPGFSKGLLVCGTLSVLENGLVKSTVEFSKLTGKESPRAKIIMIYPNPQPVRIDAFNYVLTNNSFGFWLVGVIYISSCDGTWDCKDEEFKLSAQPNSLRQLSNDLEQLLDSETCFTDVNLNCVGGPIPAHKFILCARSPVFAAMFKNPMKENQKNEVDITDMDASILRAMLTFMYTGKTSSLTISSASDLLFAADKYQLQDLKRACCDFLKENISLENVLTILVLGDMHAQDLKSFAVDFISINCTNFQEFQNKEEWKTLTNERPNLVIDVLTSIVISDEQRAKNIKVNIYPTMQPIHSCNHRECYQ